MFRTLRSWGQDRRLRGILKNSGYLFSSNTLSAFLSALQGVLAARLLGPENYGLVSGTVIVLVSNINRLLSFRMNEAVVKYLGEALAEEKKDRAGAVVKGAALLEGLTSLLAYLILLLLAPLAARFIAKDPQATLLFGFYGLVLLGNVVYETSLGVLQATRRFDRLALANLGQSLVTVTLIFAAWRTGGGPVQVLGAYLLGKLFAGLAVGVAAFRELDLTLGTGWRTASLKRLPDWRALSGFALNTNLNGTVNLAVRDSETLLIGLFRSQAEVGYFRLAQGVINLVITPIDPLIAPTYTEITRSLAQREWAQTVRLLKRVSALASAWVLPVGLALGLFGWWIIPIVYGAENAPAYPALTLLLVGYGFASVLHWNRPLLLALGMPGFALKATALTGLVKTALTFILVPLFGYLAEAAILAGYFVTSISLMVTKGFREIRKRSAIRSQPSSAAGDLQSKISHHKLKIVCISTSQIPSSTANSIQAMKACQALAQLGHAVTLLVPRARMANSDNTPQWEALANHYGLETPFEVEWLPAHPRLKRYDFSLAAVRRARALQADVLYAWPPQAALLGRLAGFPVILEMHGVPEGRYGPVVFGLFLKLKAARRGEAAGTRRLLPITQALVDLLEGQYHYRFTPGEVVVSPNGVDMERYRDLPSPPEARGRLGLPEALTLGYTGHLYAGRGMGLLVELARRFPRVSFLWVGGRPEEVAAWRGRLAEKKLTNVTLTGFVENSRLPLYQAAADLLLMPYERQIAGSSGGDSAAYASPMKMFEYMACGRAIVSSDLPVIGEVLNETNAVLCPPEEAGAWSEALESLIADPARCERLARQALEDVQRYTWLERARKALQGFLTTHSTNGTYDQFEGIL
jgi:O-antigen/teichoic acid export membrane protein/glycosyltransferase involved in cell wall biosynthesis